MSTIITLGNIGTIEILLSGNQVDTDIDLGSVTLKHEGREFILDVCRSNRYYDEDEDQTLIEAYVEIDEEIFPDCPYDLTEDDLKSKTLSAEIFISSEEWTDTPVSMFLYANVGNVEDLSIVLKEEK